MMGLNRSTIRLGIGGGVLLLGLGFQLFRNRTGLDGASIEGELGGRVPQELAGWKSRDLPLGATEVVRNQTANILRFDDYVYRQFENGNRRFAVYVAYWRPGKMPTRLIAVHTPDRCWIENGWTCSEQSFDGQINLGRATQRGVQGRVFSPPGSETKEYVLYWMNVGGVAYDFGHSLAASSGPLKWWGNFLAEMSGEQKEQMFFRLSSDRPFEALRGDPGFAEVLDALARLGLAAQPR